MILKKKKDMKLEKIVTAYRALGEAKVTKLDEGEVIKIVKARKAMRTYAEEYEAFLKDAQEKLKGEGFDELQEKVQKWAELTDEEKLAVNKELGEYQRKIDKTVQEELEREVDIEVDKLAEGSLPKLLQENGWELKKLDELEAVTA